MNDRSSGFATPFDSRIASALHKVADDIALPDQFQRPGAAVLATMRQQRKFKVRIVNVAAGLLMIVMTAGLAVAAQGGWFWLSGKFPPTDTELEALRQTVEAESRTLAQAVRAAEAASAEVGHLSLSAPINSFTVIDPFGPRQSPSRKVTDLHTGVDFSANVGDSIHAAADGVVTAAGSYPALGNVVVITHGKVNGAPVSTWYAHIGELKVDVGQTVRRGDAIALAAATGAVTGPHLHFEVRVSGSPVSPLTWVKE